MGWRADHTWGGGQTPYMGWRVDHTWGGGQTPYMGWRVDHTWGGGQILGVFASHFGENSACSFFFFFFHFDIVNIIKHILLVINQGHRMYMYVFEATDCSTT